MLYTLSRRLKSTLVKTEVPADIAKVVTQGKSVVELQNYSTDALNNYFEQDALLLPIETIKERTEAKDFSFFFEQGNFFKVVDTLEKYQQRVVNTKSEQGKEFIMFKRQLYQMYEVQNRSIEEHEKFSQEIERKNLKWLYQANMDYVEELQRVSWLDNLVDHGSLKGSVFKMKMMSDARMKGLMSWALTGTLYSHMTPIAMMVGPTAPTLGIVFTALYGMKKFYMKDTIGQIDFIREGEHKGKLRISVQKSMFSSYSIIADPVNTMSVCAIGDDDVGADDAESNILHAAEYIVESSGEKKTHGYWTVPADAHRDKTTLEWIFAIKDEKSSETDALFNDAIMERHERIAATGGISGIRKLTVQQTGYANLGDEAELRAHLDKQPDAADATLRLMSEKFGQESLEQMKPSEFYRLYKDYSQHSAKV